MLSGGITVFIYASVQVGGFSSSIKALDDAGLNNFFEYVLKFYFKLLKFLYCKFNFAYFYNSFNLNFNETYTFYSYVFGISFSYIYYVCTNQSMTQRLQSCQNQGDAKKLLV